jgi:hypothetical protein
MQPPDKKGPPGVGAPKAAVRNSNNTRIVAKKRARHKLYWKGLLTLEKVREADHAIEGFLLPFTYDSRWCPRYIYITS